MNYMSTARAAPLRPAHKVVKLFFFLASYKYTSTCEEAWGKTLLGIFKYFAINEVKHSTGLTHAFLQLPKISSAQ